MFLSAFAEGMHVKLNKIVPPLNKERLGRRGDLL